MFTFQLVFCVLFELTCIKSEALIAAVLRADSMMGKHPWLVVLRRQRSRFTLVILTILCWKGVAKQPQGNEWDSNSGDLQKCSQKTADALLCRNCNSQTSDDRNECWWSWFCLTYLMAVLSIIHGNDFLHSLMCGIIFQTSVILPLETAFLPPAFTSLPVSSTHPG